VLAAGSYLFASKTAYEFGEPPGPETSAGQKRFQANTPAYGAEIVYRLTAGTPRDHAKLVITNVRGDTVRSIDGPGGAGLHRVTWDFRGKTPPASPLSPAQKRDSIVNLRKLDRIIDSMATAGSGTREELERIKTQINGGGDLFRRRGGGGQPNRFSERPGEGPMPAGARRPGADTTGRDTTARDTTGRAARDTTARDTTARARRDTTAARRRAPGDTTARGRRGAGPAGGESGAEGEINQDLLGDVLTAMRRAGLQTGGGGFGRGGPPAVESGDYLVTLNVGDRKLQQVLRVERTANAPAGTVRPDEGDEDDPELAPPDSDERDAELAPRR
jgi:hypothetical protein